MTSIIQADADFEINEECLCFSDEEDDESVDKMVSLIRDGARFSKTMFIGGATTSDVERMRVEAEAEAAAKKKRKRKTPCQTTQTTTQAPGDAEHVASLVQDKIKGEIDRVEGKVDDLRESFVQLREVVSKHISENSAQLLVFQHSYKTILDSIASLSAQTHTRTRGETQVVAAPITHNDQRTKSRPNPSESADVTGYINSVAVSVQKTHGDTTAEAYASLPKCLHQSSCSYYNLFILTVIAGIAFPV